MTLAEMLDKLESGRIGHSEAMRWLGVDNYTALVEIAHANGRQMPGHKPGTVTAGTRALLRSVTRPTPPNGDRAPLRSKSPRSTGV